MVSMTMGRRCSYTKAWSVMLVLLLVYSVYNVMRGGYTLPLNKRAGVDFQVSDWSKKTYKQKSSNILLKGGNKRQEMSDRVEHMRKVCSQYPIRRHLTTNIGHAVRLFYVSQKYNFSYCRVAKVGSTFWTQVFLTLADMTKGKNAFDMPRDEAHETIKNKGKLIMDLDDVRVHTTTSFMVGRNPYSRLFSSYIDQIYLPNKWSTAMEMVSEKKRQRCGSDVTFEEFLSYISDTILNGEKTDLHWTPIFSICLPCQTNVTFLSKQETFDDDVDFILNEVGVDKDIVEQVNKASETSAVADSIKSLVHTYVTKGHDVKKGCITELGLAMKIWEAFKIQGHIHNDMNFPTKKFEHVTAENIEKMLVETFLTATSKKPVSKTERNQQRQGWKLQFWSEISTATMAKIQDAFYEDFYIFQYDLDPMSM